MKAVVLLAGIGRRLREDFGDKHKSLLPILGKPLIHHLMTRLSESELSEVIPVLGYDHKRLLGEIEKSCSKEKLYPVYNERFAETNNLVSLYCTKERLNGEGFVIVNGDLLFNRNILSGLISCQEDSAIALDDVSSGPIDSPRTTVKENRIYDLGRHIDHSESGGYAIGLYKIGHQLAQSFFAETEKIIGTGNVNAGFHDPLPSLFVNESCSRFSTKGLSWTDVDTMEEIPYAEKVLGQILEEEKNEIS